MDFISIIIPAFNSERWLDKTLKSVLDAIDTECEVIVVNDGSTDNTHAIASNYADKDMRFTVIDIAHVGPCAARKAGFLESQGDYVMFVDSDDLLPVTAISDQRKLLDSGAKSGNPDEPVTDGKPKIVIANTHIKSGEREFLLLSGNRRTLTGREYALEILKRNIIGFFPGHLYARDLVAAIDWDDSPEITHQENFYLLLSFAMKLEEMAPGRKEVLVDPTVTCYHYIRRGGSQSALMALSPRGLERVWMHINKLGLPEPELTEWGLEVLNRVFIERGIHFSSNFSMAADLRKRGKAMWKQLSDKSRQIVELLGSLKKRIAVSRELARTAGLTSIRPHLTIIVICYHNIAKVERSVASVFGMGFRNLEVIIVDMDSTHAERVALNEMMIRYARVRIVKVDANVDMITAAAQGLQAAEGLCVAYIRPGDLCVPGGLYDAVTRIDYGADAVLPNYRDYYTTFHTAGRRHSYAELRSTEASRNAEKTAADMSEDVYHALVEKLENPESGDKEYLVYGIVWRTDYLKRNIPHPSMFRDVKAQTVTGAFFRSMMKLHIRIVTQDKSTPPAFMFAIESYLKNWFKKKFMARKDEPEMPSKYNK